MERFVVINSWKPGTSTLQSWKIPYSIFADPKFLEKNGFWEDLFTPVQPEQKQEKGGE